MRRLLTFSALFATFTLLHAQQHEGVPFNGVITDITDSPLKGARIYVTSPERFARSDKRGRFGLTDVKPDDTLHVVYRKTHYLVPVNGRKSIRVHLGDQISPLAVEDEQLVNLGYGYVKRREQTTVSSGISGEELLRTGRTNLLDALQGKVPGLNIGPSRLGQDPTVNIRGLHTILCDPTPLYVLDGVVVNSLEFVDIHTVDHVEVLKDASIYGSRGANGAILVTTKNGR